MVKIYLKRGNTNYKEKRMVEALEKKLMANPSLESEMKPATSFDELKSLHDKYCIEDAEIVSETTSADNSTSNEPSIDEQHKDFVAKSTESLSTEKPKEIIDPFNRANPIVRDYVLKEDFTDDTATKNPTNKNFNEPTSFGQAFELPKDEPQNGAQSNTGGQSGKAKDTKQPPPFNPAFADIDAAKKKKQTKRFSKYIVESVCMLAEYGYIWFASKDINEIKMAEYELNNEIDLDVLLTLENDQEVTIKQFFANQCLLVKKDSKIPQDEKDDLADALAEVLAEKGIAPTPTQELLMIAGKIFAGQAIKCIAQKSQFDSILSQLKQRRQDQGEEAEDLMQRAEDEHVSKATPTAEATVVEPVIKETSMQFHPSEIVHENIDTNPNVNGMAEAVE